ncbi:MAG: LemA family protein [Acidobacteria bacterium]|nr:LemA family protein [Acidobacteriota bacterium]MYD72322.1 LemA family protein [Acidobacteriota bacterium]
MKKGIIAMIAIGVLGVLLFGVLIVGGFLVSRYNSLVTNNEQIDGAWAQVENVLQRRGDLIPNLVATVQGFADQEQEIFTDVANARSRLAGAVTPAEAGAANAGLTGALGRLLAISENYPQLRSNENFIRLQDELAGSENRIAVERRRYNDAVRAYNTQVLRFPTNMVAGMFGFSDREYFEADEAAAEVPQVAFQ